MRIAALSLCCLLVACSPQVNPDVDAGTGGGGGTGGAGGGTGGGSGGGGGACTESWSCSPWAAVHDAGTASRTCVDDNACGTQNGKPAESSALPALDYNFYKCRVQPIQAHSCGMIGCHGQEAGRPLRVYSRGRLRNQENICIPPMCLQAARCGVAIGQVGYANVECAANEPLTSQEWSKNFDSSRTFAIGIASPDQSELLTQGTEGSSFVHVNVKPLRQSDADYATLRLWLDGGTLPSCDAGFN